MATSTKTRPSRRERYVTGREYLLSRHANGMPRFSRDEIDRDNDRLNRIVKDVCDKEQ
jgi:hypothetical protein